MKTFVKMEMELIFDPAEAWQHAFQLENDFSSFLKTKGLQAQKVRTVEGATGGFILLVGKIPTIVETVKEDGKPPVDSKMVLDQMRSNPIKQQDRFQKGRFLGNKGYLKKE